MKALEAGSFSLGMQCAIVPWAQPLQPLTQCDAVVTAVSMWERKDSSLTAGAGGMHDTSPYKGIHTSV